MSVASVAGSTFDPPNDLFNPFAPGIMDDPYPYYAALRERDPVHHNAELGWYFLSRYEDVKRADRERTRFVRGDQARLYDGYAAAARAMVGTDNLFSKDPPDHTRLKMLFSKAFSRSRIEALRPRIEELCRQIIDELELTPGGGTLDLIADFSYPFPSLVICDLLGVPVADRVQFRSWSDGVIPIIDPVVTPAIQARGEAASAALADYLTHLLEDRRHALRAGEQPPGLITSLVEVAEEGEQLSQSELIGLCTILVLAGFETTTLTIAHAMRALVEHPDQLAALKQEPALLANLADEVLRYSGPAQYAMRQTAEDVDFAGTPVPEGSRVILLRGSANRDERRFPSADQFDLRRPDSADHVGFGEGIWYCTGAGLARLELEVAMSMLLDRLTPVGISRWVQRPSKLLWGPSEVQLEYIV